jgi:outer membrane lipopolysaccharide assembly protein LptE/RlpB
VTFQVTDPKGKILLSPQTVSETSTLAITAGQILAGSNEASNLYQQMRQAIVYDILSRLSSRQVSRILIKDFA